MAPTCTTTTRRSRPLSNQVPVLCDEQGWNAADLLMYSGSPVSEVYSPASSVSSPSSTQSDTPPPRRHTPSHRRMPGHVPRPPNAFMIFRSHYWRDNKDTIPERDHREISRTCGELWKALSSEEQQIYRDLANDAKKDHRAKYPNYKFTPVSRQKKTRKRVDRYPRIIEGAGFEMLIGGGTNGMELERAVEMNDTIRGTPSPSAIANEDQIAISMLQFSASGYQEEFICGEEEILVPTSGCDVPSLVLDTPNLEMADHLPQLPNYARIDPQFGVKADVDISSHFWFAATGESLDPFPAIITAPMADLFQAFPPYDEHHGSDMFDINSIASFNDATYI